MMSFSNIGRASVILTASCVVSALFFVQCNKHKSTDETEFRKTTIMQNVADNYIGPGYSEHKQRVENLGTLWNAFTADMSETNLENVRAAWKAAALSFQAVRMFDFGPAMTANLVASQGIFPADTIQIDANISSGSYDLAAMSNEDAAGFDALDFLLFQTNAYSKLTGSAARRQYVTDLIELMKSQINNVVNAWPAYKQTFVNSTGTEITSGFSALVNCFSKDFEIVKSAKVGIPIGTTTLGVNKPAYLEARRSGFGKELLVANITALQRLYLGNSYDGSASGTGFDDYLVALQKTELDATIGGKFNALVSTPASWNGSMEHMLNTDKPTLKSYYDLLYATVPYIKADMASAFSVVITYQDNDGD